MIAVGLPFTFGQPSPFVATPTLFTAQLVLLSSADVADEGGGLALKSRYTFTFLRNLFVAGSGSVSYTHLRAHET